MSANARLSYVGRRVVTQLIQRRLPGQGAERSRGSNPRGDKSVMMTKNGTIEL